MIRSAGTLALVLATLFLVACTDADLTREARPSRLANSSWRVMAINGVATAPAAAPTAVFKVADVSGSAGCNQYSGRYEYDASTGSIRFHEIAMTAMACAEAAKNAVEAAFSKALLQVSTASMDAVGRLVLAGPTGEIVFEVAAISG
jgi:heat shock protein HslJ